MALWQQKMAARGSPLSPRTASHRRKPPPPANSPIDRDHVSGQMQDIFTVVKKLRVRYSPSAAKTALGSVQLTLHSAESCAGSRIVLPCLSCASARTWRGGGGQNRHSDGLGLGLPPWEADLQMGHGLIGALCGGCCVGWCSRHRVGFGRTRKCRSKKNSR